MAKLIINDEEYHLPDGTRIDAVCEDAGIPFNLKISADSVMKKMNWEWTVINA